MKSLDLKDLINGLITVIIVAITIGQYGALREFAKREFIQSMKVQRPGLKIHQLGSRGMKK